MHVLRPATVALTLVATASQAEVTPAELWAHWQEVSSLEAASETTEDGALVLGGVSARMGSPDEPTTLLVDRVTLTPEAGAVRVTASDTARLDIVLDADAADRALGRIAQEGLEIVASGTPDRLDYEIRARSLALELDDLPQADDAPGRADLSLTAEGLDGTAQARDRTLVDGTFGVAALRVDLAAEDLEDGASFAADARYDALRLTLRGDMGTLGDLGDPLAYGGESAAVGIAHDGSETELRSDGPDGRVDARIESDGGQADWRVGEGRLDVTSEGEGLRVSVSGPQVPMGDAAVALDAARSSLSVPLTPGEAPQPLSLSLALEGLSLGEPVWTLFDPEGALPRDPASLTLALDGSARLDPALEAPQDGAPAGAVPWTFVTLDLTGLTLAALGAALDARGSVAFDADAPDEEQPLARPDGSIDVTLTGASGLLTTLGELGIVPEGLVLGARMGLASFFTNAEGEDVLTSTVTFAPSGAISVNGTRLR